MPVLAAYFDVSSIHILIYKEGSAKKDPSFEFINFPYSYSPEAFYNQCSEEDFNKTVIDTLLKSRKEKLADYEVITAGFLTGMEGVLAPKISSASFDLLSEVKGSFVFSINNYSIMTKDAVLSYEYYKQIERESDDCEENANISIYPQIISTEISVISTFDRAIADRTREVSFGYNSGDALVFCGGRFSRPIYYEYLDYVLMLSVLRKPGIFTLYADRNNAVLLLALLKKYKPELVVDPKDYLVQIGTLLNAPGETECLLRSGVGTEQFFDVKKDSVYIMPIDSAVWEKMSAKNHVLGSFDVEVKGGKIGLIVNTLNALDSKQTIYDNVKIFNDCVRQLSLCTSRF